MNHPKVSVILPVYNVEKYLKQCMDSIVNQTLKDIEIICVDDGSTDASLSILKEYEKEDDRVKVICQQNAGAGAAVTTDFRLQPVNIFLFWIPMISFHWICLRSLMYRQKRKMQI